jgi:hypothetical protein
MQIHDWRNVLQLLLLYMLTPPAAGSAAGFFWSLEGLKNAGEDCWDACDKNQGPCSWCGTGICCRYGWRDTSNGCDGTVGIQGKRHVCVADHLPTFPCGNWHTRMTRCEAWGTDDCEPGEKDFSYRSCGHGKDERKCGTRATCEIKSDSYEVWEDTPYRMQVTLNDDGEDIKIICKPKLHFFSMCAE